ncbi:MAG: TIGR02281 family clan AA aspartic protease [Xanthomonadales bacterium]|nr:TIGR02281 family clan AA aspartic protease [Xanthomonadales bacterium]NIN58444.1 TIGR02281 family clan AA aspartic protease [Xanthomonadales bacterium]NIN74990.1 TIGR02281 family clan AA aspartic protease [Xanthomonadales bacterium]NIO13082.1 TIGR02281 family clan AA aspartic protease [Xanthomonadales bacterium]NIP10837.1 TIGR02281 family clan AA aspartic protease [Xanthomonadales bacterium]
MSERHPGHPHRAGRRLLWLGALGLLAGLTALFQAIGTRSGGIVESHNDSGRALVVVQRDRSGHYLAEGAINGQPVRFLIDTGATDVALPEATARALGLEFGPRVVVSTAAGPMAAWMTRLERVTLGSLELSNVRATITPAPLPEALLGMSFLRHFKLRQERDQLIIESGSMTGT